MAPTSQKVVGVILIRLLMIHFSLAWLYWNPNPDVFVVPYLEHPLRWYGVCFVIGFMLGCAIVYKMFLQCLRNEKVLRPRDIASWPLLIKRLKTAYDQEGNPLHATAQKISPKLLSYNEEPTCAQKEKILLAFKNEMESGRLTRLQLEALMPEAVTQTKALSEYLMDRILWCTILGTIVGARLGYVLFYNWNHYARNPIDIFKIWEGGLASHGGTLGIIISTYFFMKIISKNYPEFSLLQILDILCIPAALVAFFIRVGNFINQEIIGTESYLPWAIIFGNPNEGNPHVPHHPVMLYEGLFYLLSFFILMSIWRKNEGKIRPGSLVGLFFILIFGSRFFFEFIKEPMGGLMGDSVIQTGQILSIPLVMLGVFLCFWGNKLVQLNPAKAK